MSIEAIAKLGKETILCEVSFPSSTTPLLPIHEVTGYPFTLEGQAEWVHDLLRMAEINPHINTVFYFYPDNYIVEDCGAASLFINDEHPKPAIYEFLEFQNSDLPLKTNPSEN
ncbi:unnamed protein product [marine sediment metagenome]|uniref:Uncharacterized protein n=1 Tax=marine sediment metagenome TaxID=412755 RepID=X1HN76_9ZZZZ